MSVPASTSPITKCASSASGQKADRLTERKKTPVCKPRVLDIKGYTAFRIHANKLIP